MNYNTQNVFDIRQANVADIDSIIDIFRNGSLQSLGMSLKEPDLNNYFKTCLTSQTDAFKIWVATDNEKIIGWQSILATRVNPFIRPYYGESSTYVTQTNIKGVATALLQKAMIESAKSELQYILGYISFANGAMKHIVEKLGWEQVGQIKGSSKRFVSPDLHLYVCYL
jgi:L-amino acid N-acyltransferase YncA